ncbi:MAG: phosphoethanolamine--lipid A transferase [Burkholderiales bacterium]|nr:MAG: phosphoethanolamine--lipid A transferase [Burkholderiales bacterium]
MIFSSILEPPLRITASARPTATSVSRPGRTGWLTNALLALWLTLAGNLPLWQKLLAAGGTGATGAWLMFSLAAMVAGLIFAVLSLASWPGIHAPVASFLVLAAAANTHFMRTYGVVIDASMMANVMHTDAREVRDLLSLPLLLTLLLVAGPALWWIWGRPMPRQRLWPQLLRNAGAVALGLMVALACGIAGYQGLASLMRNHKTVRYMISPLNTVWGAGLLAAQSLPGKARASEPLGQDARLGASYAGQVRPLLLVLVIGETARAENWGLNGYARPTTPVLEQWQQQHGLVNFPDVRSCGTNTQVSVPCIFSPLGREAGGDRPGTNENLLDVLQRAGLAVMWLDNQSGCKGVCDRVPHASTRDLQLPGLCEGGECFDEAMLHGLDERIASLDAGRRQQGVVLVMHQMGSHGPAYHRRTPAAQKRFLPECSSNALPDCTPEQLRNAYDNTIAYTDHFLGRTLQWLQAQADEGAYDTGLLYVSDHGESLGEKGLYLHGLPYAFAPDQQTRVPMATWLSPGLQQRAGLDTGCLRARAAGPVSHDHVFHSVLGLLDIRTAARQAALDLYAPCRSG